MASASKSRTQQPGLSKKDRAKLAKDTINTVIPKILASNPRSRNGISNTELIRYSHSPKQESLTAQTTIARTSGGSPAPISPAEATPKIRILQADTFDAAYSILTSLSEPSVSSSSSSISSASTALLPPKSTKRIGVLNMCSPLRPGGGVLTGALAQEESLCTRSTLFASLHDDFYRLPDDGAIYSPDVLVFRDAAQRDLPKQDRFFVDVISCAALRFPDIVSVKKLVGGSSGTSTGNSGVFESGAAGSSGTGAGERKAKVIYEYAEETSRAAMALKVRLILQIAKEKHITHLVLGALGCGAYRNPPVEVAKIFRRVICGDRRHAGVTGIEEFMFAIFDDGENIRVFRDIFRDVLA